MLYFVWPEDELRTVPGNPRRDEAVHKLLLDSHRLELEEIREDILAAIQADVQDVDRARRSIGIYPGIGQLIIDDTYVKVEWLDKYRKRPLRKVPEAPLPRMPRALRVRRAHPPRPWHLQLIHKPPGARGTGVTIGVIDTGCDPTLPDLSPPGFVPRFASYQAAPRPHMQESNQPADFGGHGSAVCAYLAGQISGVAQGATIVVAAIPASMVLTNQAMMQVALDWLNRVGCDIITTSVFTGSQGQVPVAGVTAGPSIESVEHALRHTVVVKRTFVTAAIGNIGSNGNFQHPGSSPHVMGVGAVKKSGEWFGSAFGDIGGGVHKPDIMAPGYGLQLPTSATTYDLIAGGTSFAAPIVAGAAALLLARDGNLRGDPDAIRTKLESHFVRAVHGSPPQFSTGQGLLDLSTL